MIPAPAKSRAHLLILSVKWLRRW